MTQSRTDPTTWEWSENAIVCLLNYLLDPDGFALPWERISANLTEWKAAMDTCDEQLLSINAGGYEKRYRVAGTFLYTDKPATVVSRFLSVCDGRCWIKRDGSVGITVGVFRRPEVTIGDGDILDYEMTRGQDRLTAIAGIRAQYMSPAHDYREQDADPWPDGVTVMALGEDRVASLDLLWVPSFSQARRLMKRAALRESADWRGSIRTTLAGLRAIDERYVEIEIAELGISRSFEVSRFQIDPNTLECSIELLAVGEEIDAWDAATEEGTPASQTAFTAWRSEALTLDPGGDYSGYSIRHIVLGTSITATGSQLRVTFRANTALVVSHVSIVPRSGSTDDGTTTPTEITFGGISGFSVGAGAAITSDWITFAMGPGTDDLVIFDVASGRPMQSANSGRGDDWYFLPGTTSWDTQTVSGFFIASGATWLSDFGVEKIEVRAGA